MRILLAGGGHTAEFIARRLIREGNELTILEQEEVRCHYLEAFLDAQIVHGNAASIAACRRAGLAEADMLIGITQSDEVNVMTCLIANAEAPQAVKAIRLRTHEFAAWHSMLEERGIQVDRIIHPESDIVSRIFRVLAVPGVSDIRDFAEGEIKVFGMNVEAQNWLAGKRLSDLERAGPPKNGMVAMIFRGQEVIIPHGDEIILAGDHIYVVTTREDLDDCLRFMGIRKHASLHRVFIVGGGEVGVTVAEILEAQGVSVKVFEHNPTKCERIAGVLKKSIVIHADGTDQETLLRENVEGVDAFLALTKDDDANLIVSLLARRLGARKLVALVNRVHYLLLAQRLGINTTVSPRMKTVDAVLEFIRKGGVLSVRTFGEEEAEAIELVVPRNSKYIGRPLRTLAFPRGAIVGAIARPNGEVMVPRGEAVIQEGDRVIFLALESAVGQLESAFLANSRRFG